MLISLFPLLRHHLRAEQEVLSDLLLELLRQRGVVPHRHRELRLHRENVVDERELVLFGGRRGMEDEIQVAGDVRGQHAFEDVIAIDVQVVSLAGKVKT